MLVRTSVAPIHFRVLCSFPSCSEPCTSNPRVQAASTIFCSRNMLGIAVRDGPCVPHAEYIASLYVVLCSNEERSICRFLYIDKMLANKSSKVVFSVTYNHSPIPYRRMTSHNDQHSNTPVTL